VTTRLSLRIAPGARRPGVAGRHGSGWKVRVAAVPEDGKANAAVVSLLADVLSVPSRDVEIVSGHGSRDKTVALAGIDLAETERRLAAACSDRKEHA
jgi:uncharacterized protein (TIGR00251 family)